MLEIKIEKESRLKCIGMYIEFIYKKKLCYREEIWSDLMSVYNLCLRKDLGNIFVLLPDFDIKSLITKVVKITFLRRLWMKFVVIIV